MGDWFRLAPKNNYWSDPHYYRATILRLRAVLGLAADNQDYAEQDLSILRHLRYIDLKATEGSGSITDPPIEIQSYVHKNIDQITQYWKSDTPEITVLLGWAAQRVFEQMVKHELIEANLAHLKRVGLSHPSQFWHDLGFVDAENRLRPLSGKLHYWQPIAKKWKVGIP